MKEYSKKLLFYLETKKKNAIILSTRKELASHLGISHQQLYNLFKTHAWSNTDIYALSQLFSFDTNYIRGIDLTKEIYQFLTEQRIKKRKEYWTKKDAADYLGLSVVSLYKRFKKHDWKEHEILKIKKL